MQDADKILPLFLNLDTSYDSLKPFESPCIKGLTWDVNANPVTGNGLSNPSGEGQNLYSLTPVRSNVAIPGVLLPAGINKSLLTFECEITKELYHANYNYNGLHGIYVLDGDTGVWSTVIEDPELGFSDNAENFMPDIRWRLRIVKDSAGNISEKHLLITDGQSWQKWINVIAAQGSNGFNAAVFPYWKLQPPHFDRRELLEWAIRPPMIKPVVEPLPNGPDDAGKINKMVDTAIRVAIAFENTDTRTSTLSPYSLPYITKAEEFLNNPDSLPKSARAILPAGSPLTEKIRIYVQRAGGKNTLDSVAAWGDWYLYDVIYKFKEPATGQYWLREDPWADYNYDTQFNTIQYTIDLSRVMEIASQDEAIRLQNSLPQLSYGITDVNDRIALGGNREGYNNLTRAQKDLLSAEVKQKDSSICIKPLRKIKLYAYIGMCDTDFLYKSQVGYYNGDDKQMRFGGLREASSIIDTDIARIDIDESKFFDLDFADRDAFRAYCKGTPYYADGKWFQVNSDNSLVEISDLLDFSSNDVLEYVQGVFKAGGYFVCMFELTVPADRYNIAVGRHNVESGADYRGTSTYVYGIANSRQKTGTQQVTPDGVYTLTTIKPDAIGTASKEMEIDCVAADVDVWGNGSDLFYIYCPYNKSVSGAGNFRFIEGYFEEAADNPFPIELFPYAMTGNNADDWGKFTDKNGFYWAYTKVNDSGNVDIEFTVKLNCLYPKIFTIPTSEAGTGWKKNPTAFLADNNSGVVGDCNRIIVNGSIRNLSGTIGYSNIGVSVKDGPTVYSRPDGTFTLVLHNGQNTQRVSNVYINAGGSFIITIAGCGQVPLGLFDETLVPCIQCEPRIYPLPINLNVNIESFSERSLKESGKYEVGVVVADLAGRLTFVNVIEEIEVSSFLQRNNLNATYAQLLINAAFNIAATHPDAKWFSPCISKNTSTRKYVQWVGDKITYIDNGGNIVSDAASAVFCAIRIDSLYNYNRTNNFSVLANYQFLKTDRLRVYDDGDGNLFDVATYGDPLDLQVLGTNYNQAAINAGLLPPETNTVFNTTAAQQTQDQSVSVIVRYDARLDKLKDKTGFWIEIYTPAQESDLIPFLEVAGFYPIINGAVQEFMGFVNGLPVFNTLTEIILEYWDTYFLNRNISIPDVGNKFFSHPFESPNISDSWGANVTSGGRVNVKNDNAKQQWRDGHIIVGDIFSVYKQENGYDYGTYPYGGIVGMHTKRNMVIVSCTQDWYILEFDTPYARTDQRGLLTTNSDRILSLPRGKSGSVYGVSREHVGTIIVDNNDFYWHDAKNTGVIRSNYVQAWDITELNEEKGERGGMQSYMNQKTWFISKWNNEHDRSRSWDVVYGIDTERGNIYVTFRNRRGDSNELSSYVNDRRNVDIRHQETFVYNTQYRSWIPLQNFAPEAYGRLRGKWANEEFLSFAAGKPYYHNNTPNDSFLNFYGVQTNFVLMGVFNKGEGDVKFLENLSIDMSPKKMWVDMIYSDEGISFSYLPFNLVRKRENQYFGAALRNMVSYPPIKQEELFRSMLQDGKRNFGKYFVCRFVGDMNNPNEYVQIKGIYYQQAKSPVSRKEVKK